MSRYKFSLTQKIRDYVEWRLEHYHEDKKQLEQYKNDMIPSATNSYSMTGGVSRGSVSQPTENIAIRMATSPYILATERSCADIERALSRFDKIDMQLIDLVYWKRSYTIIGAGEKVGLAKSDAYAHINKILGVIALEMGLVNL